MILLDKDEPWPLEQNPAFHDWMKDGSKYSKTPPAFLPKQLSGFLYDFSVRSIEENFPLEIMKFLLIHPDFEGRLYDERDGNLWDRKKFAELEVIFSENVGLEIKAEL